MKLRGLLVRLHVAFNVTSRKRYRIASGAGANEQAACEGSELMPP